jgi:hypothetical protein
MTVVTTTTLSGFLTFIRQIMGIKTRDLPDNSPYIELAYAVALELVLPGIKAASALLYQQAVYNLAGDNLVTFAMDQPGCHFFEELRDKLNILKFTAGVVSSSSDQGTSQSLEVIKAAKDFTLGNLQNLKTPWGRAYLAIAQAYGPSIWGLT